MRESGILLEKGLHPLVLVNGFREAMDKTIQALMNHSDQVSITDESILQSVARTAMTGTSVESVGKQLAGIIVSFWP